MTAQSSSPLNVVVGGYAGSETGIQEYADTVEAALRAL